MGTELYFEKDLIFRDLTFSENLEALRFLSDKLYQGGYVKESYQEAIVEREMNYPTGLPSVDIKIAIPHCDYKLVNRAAIAIGILKEPVIFRSMDDPERELEVHIIMMLALDQPHGHLNMLQKIINLVKDQEVLKGICKAASSEEVMEKLKPYLL
ncbi:PTS sugar transporter subunit IIA [Alkaliphilus crotonatoxidans]